MYIKGKEKESMWHNEQQLRVQNWLDKNAYEVKIELIKMKVNKKQVAIWFDILKNDSIKKVDLIKY